MRKYLKTLLILFFAVYVLIPTNVFADFDPPSYGTIQIGDKLIYSSKEDAVIETVEGVTYDASSRKLTLENVHLENLHIDSTTAIVELKGDNVIDNYVYIACAKVTFIGDGSLTIKGAVPLSGGSSIFTNREERDDPNHVAVLVKFDMTGTITALKGIGGAYDDELAEREEIENYSSLVLGDGVQIAEGGAIKTENYMTFIGTEDTTSSTYSQVKVVIKGKQTANPDIPEESDENHTVVDGTTSFTSKDALNPDYSLSVTDIKDMLSDEDTTLFEKEVDNSRLLLLYDISVVDGSDQVVPMDDGEYKIRLKISEEDLENYDTFTAFYVDDDGNFVETFDTTVDGEYVEFVTTHLSIYGILGSKSAGVNNPNTSDQGMLILLVVGISLIGVAVTSNLLRKRLVK